MFGMEALFRILFAVLAVLVLGKADHDHHGALASHRTARVLSSVSANNGEAKHPVIVFIFETDPGADLDQEKFQEFVTQYTTDATDHGVDLGDIPLQSATSYDIGTGQGVLILRVTDVDGTFGDLPSEEQYRQAFDFGGVQTLHELLSAEFGVHHLIVQIDGQPTGTLTNNHVENGDKSSGEQDTNTLERAFALSVFALLLVGFTSLLSAAIFLFHNNRKQRKRLSDNPVEDDAARSKIQGSAVDSGGRDETEDNDVVKKVLEKQYYNHYGLNNTMESVLSEGEEEDSEVDVDVDCESQSAFGHTGIEPAGGESPFEHIEKHPAVDHTLYTQGCLRHASLSTAIVNSRKGQRQREGLGRIPVTSFIVKFDA